MDQNGKLFDEALGAQMRLLGLSVAAFAFQLWLAVSATAASIVLVLWLEAALAIVFGAIALLATILLWAAQPLRLLERHLGIVSMLHVIRNTYMTGLMRMPDSPTLQNDIERLKSSAMRDLTQLLVTVEKRRS